MALQIGADTYLNLREAGEELDLGPQTLRNYLTLRGDRFLRRHRDVVPGRVFFRLDEVRNLARERATR